MRKKILCIQMNEEARGRISHSPLDFIIEFVESVEDALRKLEYDFDPLRQEFRNYDLVFFFTPAELRSPLVALDILQDPEALARLRDTAAPKLSPQLREDLEGLGIRLD